MQRVRRGAIWLAAWLSAGCLEREPLPMPFPMTWGGTPVPAHGFGGTLQTGGALRGQELRRAQATVAGIAAGFEDIVSASYHLYWELREGGQGGEIVQGKIRVPSPFGSRTSLAIHGATAWSRVGPFEVQDDRLRSYDVAVPLEVLWSPVDDTPHLSAFAGPRAVYERYTDLLDPAQSVRVWHWGGIAGFHLNVGRFHLFGEATVTYAPQTTFRGERFDGRLVLLPAIGITVHSGQPYPWGSER